MDSKDAEADPIVTTIRKRCGQAVKCVTGFDAKEAGREQPASYIVPQKKRFYAKTGAEGLRFFAGFLVARRR